MKNKIKLFIALIAICIGSTHINAQQVNSLYFLENAPVRHYLNPAFQPLSGFYFGLPVLGYTQFGLGNNSFTIHSLTLNKDNAFSAIRPTTLFRTDLQLNLLDFGFRTKKAYWSFGLTEKIEGQIGLPKDLFKLALYGTPNIDNNLYNLGSLNFGVNAYTEAALGYSRILNDKWSVGAKVKGLLGNANISAKFENFELNAGIEEWTLKAEGGINSSSPAKIQVGDNFSSFDVDIDPSNPSTFLKPAGMGIGFDLGATFKPIEALTISAALIDLGMIRWKTNVNSVDLEADYRFDGTGSFTASDFSDDDFMDATVDTLLQTLKESVSYSTNQKAYNTSLSPKLNLGAEYAFFDNRLSVGLLSRTMFQKKAVYEELTGSINYKPINWFNIGLSYSAINGRFSNIGAGLGMRIGFINAFISADYIPIQFTELPLSTIGVDPINLSEIPVLSSMGTISNVALPYKTDRFNMNFGFNIVFSNKQDKDKDGVRNNRDKCPDTPKGVEVDKKGCPVDNDGDGIADYLDLCPETPEAAYGKVDANGCPTDEDGDGIFDYIDECPGTVAEARGHVNEKGCPKDTDNDGIFDYLDRCANTPDSVKVDEFGCPIDTDDDGVADYLDLCPDTPAQAKGMVDKNGCPLDSDDDGIYDYLDLCSNTPVEARGFVDKNGCPLDSDDDGVADYLDKCPDTPIEARGMVDEKGCPRDTDGDSIPDYLDNCPKLAGVASNKGCPEIKKEVRTLFQKALQGIQFESGKAIIKKTSNTILNQIAKVLIDNPTYLIEVQGHTDNVGKVEMNQTLSENRASAVRDYLINKGVEEKRITAKGYGDTKPVATNKTAQGRAKNRRVEFMVTFEEVKYEEIKFE
ncbi:MAG: OmpA family protein [Paludibacteraceae bacterium]|nr:OmpA family protein [Paludibacteraceae bacterium]